MFAARLLCGLGIGLLLASPCVYAQDNGEAPARPLDLRPQAQPKTQGPLQKPAAKTAAKPKPKAKPAPKVAAAPAHAPAPSPSVEAPPPAPQASKPAAPQERVVEKPAAVEPAKPAPERPPFDEMVVAQFCTSLSSAASDGRLAWQAKRMEEMEERLRARIAELEAKRAETADWLKRREEAMRAADETVVAIYSKMKPDAAAAQFSAMDESGAAAILSKLNPRMASTVLNEIDPSRAARIAAEMAGVGVRREALRSVP